MKKEAFSITCIFLGLVLRLFLMIFSFHPHFIELYFYAYRHSLGELQPFHSPISTGLQFLINIWFSILTRLPGDLTGFLELLPRGIPLDFESIPSTFYYSVYLLPFLFLAHIPFFLADMGCLYIIARKFRSLKAVFFWLFNPVILICVYILGRPEIIIVFLIIYGYYSFHRQKQLRSYICFLFAHLFFPALLLFSFPIYFMKPENGLFQQLAGITVLSIITHLFYPELFLPILVLSTGILVFFCQKPGSIRILRITPLLISIYCVFLLAFNFDYIYYFQNTLQRILDHPMTVRALSFHLFNVNNEIYFFMTYIVFAMLWLLQKKITATHNNIINVLVLHSFCLVLLMTLPLSLLLVILPLFYIIYRHHYQHVYTLLVIAGSGFMFSLFYQYPEVFTHAFLILSPAEFLNQPMMSEPFSFQLASVGTSILFACVLFVLAKESYRLKNFYG